MLEIVAYVSMNSRCVNTLDLRPPTGRPLADVTESPGGLLSCEKKKLAPKSTGEELVRSGEARLPSRVGGHGFAMICSYMSRRTLNGVGKKISKYPCLTRRVEHGIMVSRTRVCTTGAL